MKYIIYILLIVLIFSCSEVYTPKPRGYFRIDFPEKKYQALELNLPYYFEYPEYCEIKIHPKNKDWINIEYPRYKGTIHISYLNINKNLLQLSEDSRTFAYKHSVKANAIDEEVISDLKRDIYGILYNIKGNTASSVQFYLSDSTNNFIRGALYFETQPNLDSLKPVIDFCKIDILHLIETLSWKNKSE